MRISDWSSDVCSSDLIVKAKDDYNRRMVTAASTFITEMDGGKNYIEKFSAEATRTGWATSGVFYMTLARMQGALYAKAAELPSIGAIDVTALGDRKSVVSGKRVSVRVYLGCSGILKKKKK